MKTLRPLSVLLAATLIVGALTQQASATSDTLTTGECAQQVSGLTGEAVNSGRYCLVAIKGGPGNWVVPAGVRNIELLVIGGGGGGGWFGGGGAGAMLETRKYVSPGTSIEVSIGEGGARASGATVAGSNGSATSFGDLIVYGGGGGSSADQAKGATVYSAASPGGSGGGAAASPIGPDVFVGEETGTSPLIQNIVSGSAAGTAGSGFRNKGGDSGAIYVYFADIDRSVSVWMGGGGGGAESAGGDISWTTNGLVNNTQVNTSFAPGSGGSGKASSLLDSEVALALKIGEVSDSRVFFAGGGGGRANFQSAGLTAWWLPAGYTLAGNGGLGGGGGVGSNRTINGVKGSSGNDGFANTGAGGRFAHAGGSGLVVIRYEIPRTFRPNPPIAPSPEVVQPETLIGSIKVNGYLGESRKAIRAMKTKIRTYIEANPSINSVTLVAFPSGKGKNGGTKVAERRAKVVETYLKKISPALNVSIKLKKVEKPSIAKSKKVLIKFY